MGLDDIHLTIPLCKSLFPDGLIYGKTTTENTGEKIHFSGKNLKFCLVLIDTGKELESGESELLDKLLGACHLSKEDIALVNLSEQPVPVSKIISDLKIKKALFFGVPNSGIDLPIPDKEDKVLNTGECALIKTLPLSGLLNNAGRKKSLWIALKELFNL